jgi:hypothetical protein
MGACDIFPATKPLPGGYELALFEAGASLLFATLRGRVTSSLDFKVG